jgi:hypothetical protein
VAITPPLVLLTPISPTFALQYFDCHRHCVTEAGTQGRNIFS